jgi:cytoskeletal protein CcmA (bactofilin family)
MSIFKKNEPQPMKPRERPIPQPRAGSADGAISIIGYGMSVVGDITTEGIVRVEGEVRGTIRAAKSVILGHGGVVEGNIYTADAVIGGSVNGAIEATNRLELQSSSTVNGEIRAPSEHLKLEEGARFSGQVQMLDTDIVRAPGLLSGPGASSVGSTNGSAAALPPGNNMFASTSGPSAESDNGGEELESTESGGDKKKKNAGV